MCGSYITIYYIYTSIIYTGVYVYISICIVLSGLNFVLLYYLTDQWFYVSPSHVVNALLRCAMETNAFATSTLQTPPAPQNVLCLLYECPLPLNWGKTSVNRYNRKIKDFTKNLTYLKIFGRILNSYSFLPFYNFTQKVRLVSSFSSADRTIHWSEDARQRSLYTDLR